MIHEMNEKLYDIRTRLVFDSFTERMVWDISESKTGPVSATTLGLRDMDLEPNWKGGWICSKLNDLVEGDFPMV